MATTIEERPTPSNPMLLLMRFREVGIFLFIILLNSIAIITLKRGTHAQTVC